MPGEIIQVSFTIHSEDLNFYRKDMSVGNEPGSYEVFIGGNSRDVHEAIFTLEKDGGDWKFSVKDYVDRPTKLGL